MTGKLRLLPLNLSWFIDRKVPTTEAGLDGLIYKNYRIASMLYVTQKINASYDGITILEP